MRRNKTLAEQRDKTGQLDIENRRGLHIIEVRTLGDLEPHAPAWNRLAAKAERKLPMSSYDWISAHFQHKLQHGESWLCLFAYDGPDLFGVLPLTIKQRNFLGLKWLDVRLPSSKHTVSVDCLIEPGFENEVIPEFISFLDQLRPRIRSFEMKRLPECSPMLVYFRNHLGKYAYIMNFDGYGSHIKVAGSYDEFKKRLKKRMVRNLRRLGRKLECLDEVEFHFITDTMSHKDCLKRFMQVEDSCWKGKKGSSIIRQPRLIAFYSAMTRNLMGSGRLEWQLLNTEDKTIAANIAIRMGRTLVIFKIAYDEEYCSYSPGSKLFEKMVMRAFESGEIDEIDCLSDYPWNRDWLMEQRPYFNLCAYPFRILPLISGFLPKKLYDFVRSLRIIRNSRRSAKQPADLNS